MINQRYTVAGVKVVEFQLLTAYTSSASLFASTSPLSLVVGDHTCTAYVHFPTSSASIFASSSSLSFNHFLNCKQLMLLMIYVR